MSESTRLSVVICTKNEERNIQRCLNSIQSIADEIVVVDSLSTDKTPALCLATPKVKFYPMPWEGFAQTKNKANQLAQNPYILSLDADEELTPELQQEILKLKNQGLRGVYRVNRLTNYCGTWIHHSGWFPDKKIRLFPKAHAKWVGDHVHEILESPEIKNVTDLKGLLNHYSVYSVSEHLQKIKSYSSLGAEKMAKKKPLVILVTSLIFNPPLRFIRHYILKLGFLDGGSGVLIAALSSYSVFLKYKKALQIKLRKAKD